MINRNVSNKKRRSKWLQDHFCIVSAVLLFFVISGCTRGCSPEEHRAGEKKDAFQTKTLKKIDANFPSSKRAVLIVIDTLRADRLGAYGYKKDPTSPNIDKIAKESVLFERFYAASPWTAPSFATMLTGVSPTVHGTGKRIREKTAETKRVRGMSMYPINSGLKTLAELLKGNGARTGAVVRVPFLHPVLGFKRGFDFYDLEIKNRVGNLVTDIALEWLDKNTEGSFFAMLHYFDPHAPYRAIPEYKETFAPGDPGRIEEPFNNKPEKLVSMDLTDNELDYIKGLYNQEVRFADEQVGQIYNYMKKEDMLDDTWLIIVADHGEEHMDHGWFFHATQYWDEVVRVPLIIRAPGGEWAAGRRVPFSASHKDLLPTILEMFDMEPPEYVEGETLFSLIRGTEQENRTCYMEYQLSGHQHYAFFDGRYKFIKSVDGKSRSLFDLSEDPLEKHKLNQNHPEMKKMDSEVEKYRDSLARLKKKIHRGDSQKVIPQDVEETLRNLGYID